MTYFRDVYPFTFPRTKAEYQRPKRYVYEENVQVVKQQLK
jgi:hypothetical protein